MKYYSQSGWRYQMSEKSCWHLLSHNNVKPRLSKPKGQTNGHTAQFNDFIFRIDIMTGAMSKILSVTCLTWQARARRSCLKLDFSSPLLNYPWSQSRILCSDMLWSVQLVFQSIFTVKCWSIVSDSCPPLITMSQFSNAPLCPAIRATSDHKNLMF